MAVDKAGGRVSWGISMPETLCPSTVAFKEPFFNSYKTSAPAAVFRLIFWPLTSFWISDAPELGSFIILMPSWTARVTSLYCDSVKRNSRGIKYLFSKGISFMNDLILVKSVKSCINSQLMVQFGSFLRSTTTIFNVLFSRLNSEAVTFRPYCLADRLKRSLLCVSPLPIAKSSSFVKFLNDSEKARSILSGYF